MERREALKNIGLSFGFVVASPAVFSILQSCGKEEIAWAPQFFSEQQGSVLRKLVDIILPETEDAPSATQANVHTFIDKYIDEVVEKEERDLIQKQLNLFIQNVLTTSGKEDVKKLEDEDIEPLLAASLKKTKEEEQAIMKTIGEHMEAMEQGKVSDLNEDLGRYALLSNFRWLTIWAYKSNEYVGKNLLEYTSIPGQQKGCVDVQEATGGKAWAL